MFDGVIDHAVYHFLVDFARLAGALSDDGRETHHAEAEEGDFVAVLRIRAVSHLVFGDIEGGSRRIVVVRASGQTCGGGAGDTHRLEEVAAADFFFMLTFHIIRALGLNHSVIFMTFYIQGAERTGRAQILARAATDTFLFVYDRNLEGVGVRRVGGDHLDSLCRAMALTIVAGLTVAQRNTVFLNPNSVSDLCSRFVGDRERLDSPRRTNLGTLDALRTAITTLERHLGLHHFQQRGGRTQHFIRTNRYTELARGTMLGEIAQAEGTRRRNRRSTLGNLLLLDRSQTAIDGFLLRLQRRGSRQSCTNG